MKDSSRVLALLIAGCIPGCIQSEAQQFDVASVRPASPNNSPTLPPETVDPGRWAFHRMPLMFLVMRAYTLSSYRVIGPAWLDSERFDIAATFPAGTTNDARMAMLRSLLAERFHLTVHWETKEMNAWELVVGKGGAKLLPTDYKGEKTGISLMTRSGSHGLSSTVTAHAQAVSDLVPFLSRQLNAEVNDRTGLDGRYDFTLEFVPGWAGNPSGVEESFYPALLTAVQEQLGLKLQPRKAPVEMLIVDKAVKIPTDN